MNETNAKNIFFQAREQQRKLRQSWLWGSESGTGCRSIRSAGIPLSIFGRTDKEKPEKKKKSAEEINDEDLVDEGIFFLS